MTCEPVKAAGSCHEEIFDRSGSIWQLKGKGRTCYLCVLPMYRVFFLTGPTLKITSMEKS